MIKFIKNSVTFILILSSLNTIAQKPVASNGDNKQRTFQRCGTDEAIQRQMETIPEFRAMMEKRERDYQNYVKANLNNPSALATRTTTLTGPVTIPVVVHIVLPNPNIITDADVEYFINRLNLDFSGLNPDSTNGAAFYNVRGHSLLRFQLARRDPSGNYTTGIERLSGTTEIGNGEPQAIKNAATTTGGLNPWPFQQYYNLWVGGNSTGLLGIAPAIGPGTTANDGICVNYQVFSNSGCGYSIPAFAMARTAIHEIGHNFGLYHIFSGCSAGADFGQLTSTGCTLPSNLLAGSDDTPTLGTATSGCPTGSVASACAGVPNPPGKMYQNYMDYTDDACYSMFTKAQVDRIHYVLEFCRGGGYLTTLGHFPPAGMPALDAAAMEIVSPGGSELVGCTAVSYPAPVCPGSFQPKIRIENRGSSTINTITVALSVNATVVANQTFTGLNIPTYKNAVVTFTATQNLVAGANVILYTLSAPNGGTDAIGTNNTATTTLNISTTTPFVQDFTGTAFPPANMTNNLGAKWVRNAAGNGNAGSAFIDNYNNATVGELSDLRSFPINPGSLPLDSMVITWDLAHKNYGSTYNDTLSILVSNNCGVSFTEVWKRGGAGLATAGSSTAAYTTTVANDWKAQRVAIGGSLITSGPIIVVFRNKNLYGNNIFLDNINVAKKANSIVPIYIINFVGKLHENTIELEWVTSHEENFGYFEIEYSRDASTFNKIGKLNSIGNNTINNNKYQFTHRDQFGEVNYYRLKIVDKDGTFRYSNIIKIETGEKDNLFSIFPNPANDFISVEYALLKNSKQLFILDAIGKIIKKITLDKNSTKTIISTKEFSSGNYQLMINNGGFNTTKKLIIQK